MKPTPGDSGVHRGDESYGHLSRMNMNLLSFGRVLKKDIPGVGNSMHKGLKVKKYMGHSRQFGW